MPPERGPREADVDEGCEHDWRRWKYLGKYTYLKCAKCRGVGTLPTPYAWKYPEVEDPSEDPWDGPDGPPQWIRDAAARAEGRV